jgi:peptidoglycan/xylan/chitin deacetylase (PgdA/CDA1 family)
VLDDLARWAGCDTSAARPSHRTLSPAEVRELAADGLVKLGAHTVTHPRLSALSERDQAFELTRSRQELEEAVGHDVTALSYPYGGKNDFTAATVAAAGRAGFSCACTTIRAPVLNGADPLRLPRYVAPDVDAGRFERLLDQWLTVRS